MKKTLYDFKDSIKDLPLKDKYTKEELLKDDFLIDKEGNIEIYYAPHNEYINPRAEIFIIGITPGFAQMSTAMAAARKGIEEGEEINKIQYKCKVAGRFSGTIRKNIITMLDDLELNKILNIKSCSELFHSKDYLLHTVSLIPYSVFVKKANYTGHTPKLIKSEFLMKYVYDNFINELKSLHNAENIILIPLGKAVEEVLCRLAEENIISNSQILKGFPHPSGANVNRITQFEDNRKSMSDFIIEKFKNKKF